MAARKSNVKRAAEALLSDDSSALTFAGGLLFDVVFDGIREHEQRRNASKGVSKRKPWADALAEDLAATHPNAPTVRLCGDEFLPQDGEDRRYAGFEVWRGVDKKGRKVLKANKGDERQTEITLETFRREYLGPAHRRAKANREK